MSAGIIFPSPAASIVDCQVFVDAGMTNPNSNLHSACHFSISFSAAVARYLLCIVLGKTHVARAEACQSILSMRSLSLAIQLCIEEFRQGYVLPKQIENKVNLQFQHEKKNLLVLGLNRAGCPHKIIRTLTVMMNDSRHNSKH